MSNTLLFLLLITLTLATFLPRYLPLLLANHFTLPPLVQRALAYVPIAVLTAIVVQTIFVRQSVVVIDVQNPTLWAAIVAAVLAWRRVSLLIVVVVGMLVYGALRWSWG